MVLMAMSRKHATTTALKAVKNVHATAMAASVDHVKTAVSAQSAPTWPRKPLQLRHHNPLKQLQHRFLQQPLPLRNQQLPPPTQWHQRVQECPR